MIPMTNVGVKFLKWMAEGEQLVGLELKVAEEERLFVVLECVDGAYFDWVEWVRVAGILMLRLLRV